MLEEDAPPGSRIIPGFFVIGIKVVETANKIFNAPSVGQKYSDAEKYNLVHDSTNVRQISVRLLIADAATMGYAV